MTSRDCKFKGQQFMKTGVRDSVIVDGYISLYRNIYTITLILRSIRNYKYY